MPVTWRGGRRHARALVATALGLMVTAPAWAVLPGEVYQRAREQAANHLQLRIDEVRRLHGFSRALCRVRATALRDFRGAVAAGTPLEFQLQCSSRHVRPVPGPNGWYAYSELKQARYVEGYFNRGRPVYGRVGVIPVPRATQWCHVDSVPCDRAGDAAEAEEQP